MQEVNFIANVSQSASAQTGSLKPSTAVSHKISDIEFKSNDRAKTGIEEVDRVLGGGFVKGQAVLLAGEPGIGKSTLLLQLANSVKMPVYYICGEESPYQVKQRYTRLSLTKKNIELVENNVVETIDRSLIKQTPSLLILDSVHSLFSARFKSSAGSLSQIKYTSQYLVKLAKNLNIPLVLVGQINKQGDIAGPKALEHLVDSVLFLEGDNDHTFRVLRSIKNRFGSVNEIGLFTMESSGMVQVINPSKYLLSGKVKNAPGSCVGLVSEGTRCYAIEVQALVNKTNFGYPKRTANGFSINKLSLLAAVLEKRLKLRLSEYDIYLNVASGINIKEPAVDLAVCMALVSAYKNKSLPDNSCFYGEVGLNGEIRPVKMQDIRAKEAKKVGLTKIFSPKNNKMLSEVVHKAFK
jgi:DNA repair protein RadA/Sms